MAYPEPTPVIRGRKNVEEFLRRLENFKLTPEQMKGYRDAIERRRRHSERANGRPLQLTAVIRKGSRFYVSWCPDLDIASQGKTFEIALSNLKEAVELYLENEDAQVIEGTPIITTFEVHDGSATRHLRKPT